MLWFPIALAIAYLAYFVRFQNRQADYRRGLEELATGAYAATLSVEEQESFDPAERHAELDEEYNSGHHDLFYPIFAYPALSLIGATAVLMLASLLVGLFSTPPSTHVRKDLVRMESGYVSADSGSVFVNGTESDSLARIPLLLGKIGPSGAVRDDAEFFVTDGTPYVAYDAVSDRLGLWYFRIQGQHNTKVYLPRE